MSDSIYTWEESSTSILIKGLTMPTNDELLCIKIYPNGKVAIDMDLECKQIATAVRVPPHGRLKDADELLRYKEREVCSAEKIVPEIRYVVDTRWIDEAPTVIPAEEGER